MPIFVLRLIRNCNVEGSVARDLTKTATFAALHFGVGFAVAYAFTGSLAIATGVAVVEPLANTVVFFLHERAWNRLGRPRRISRPGTGGFLSKASPGTA